MLQQNACLWDEIKKINKSFIIKKNEIGLVKFAKMHFKLVIFGPIIKSCFIKNSFQISILKTPEDVKIQFFATPTKKGIL